MGDERLRVALGYRRFTGVPKVLVLDTGYLVVRDVIDGANDLGWKVTTLETRAKGKAQGDFVADLLKALITDRPDFVLTINHLGYDEDGVLADLLSRYEILQASWFVDHPLPIIGGSPKNVTPHTQVFCFERTALDWIVSQGYENPVYLPTGANTRIFSPDRLDPSLVSKFELPLTFVGNSWWTKARGEPSSWEIKAAKEISRNMPVHRKALAGDFAKKLEKMKLRLKQPRGRYTSANIALAEASMRTRQRVIEELGPIGLTVFGDPHWEKLTKGVSLRPPVDYATELNALFAASTINVNITAEQMPTAVNQRVWDVPAVGGFLVTDAQEDALEFFDEGEEIVVYREKGEGAELVKYYLEHPEESRTIALRAKEKVDRAHGMGHRLEKLYEVMRNRN